MQNLAFVVLMTGVSASISGPPKPAVNMAVSNVTFDSVVLSWQQTSSFRSVLVRYRATSSETTAMCEESYNPGANQITVAGLSGLTDYEFYVIFDNGARCSQASGPQYASTERPAGDWFVRPVVIAVLILLSVFVIFCAACAWRLTTFKHLLRLQQQQRQTEQAVLSILAELLASNENLRRVPPATEDEIMELPVIRIIQAELDKRCAICHEEYHISEEARSLPCGHIYHERCVRTWLQRSGTCPMCRQRVTARPALADLLQLQPA